MKSITQIFLVSLALFFFNDQIGYSQAVQKILTPADYSGNFIDLAGKAKRFYDTATRSNRAGYKRWKRFEWFASHHLNEDGRFDNYLQKNAAALQSFNQLQANRETSTNSTTGNWINIGHTTALGKTKALQGRVNTVAFDPVDGDIVYVGAAAGGIWKTTTGGDGWINLTVDLPILGISDIAVAPAPNNNIIYALSGEGIAGSIYSHKGIGVIKSTNGGLSWQATGLMNTLPQQVGGNKLLIHPTNPNYVLAAMSNGLFRTTDGGNMWTQIGDYDINDIEFKPNNPNILYLARRGVARLWKLDLVTLAPMTFTDIISPDVNAPSLNRMEIGVTPDNPEAVYVLAGPGYVAGSMNLFYGLFYSGNGGSSFTMRNNNSCCHLFGAESFEISGYANTIYVNPFNEDNVIVAGLGVFSSNNGGTTLTLINDESIHADQHNLRRNPVTGDLWLCNDGGVYISTNSGVDWNNKSSGLVINEYYRISGTQTSTDDLLGGLQDNGFFLRTPGTSSYTSVFEGDGMDSYFNSFDNDIVYACAQNGLMLRSTNGGVTLTNYSLPNRGNGSIYAWITPFVQHPPDLIPPIGNTDIIYVYSFIGVMQGTNGGNTWTPMGPAGMELTWGTLNPSMAIGSSDLGATANLYISNGNNFWVHSDPLSANSAGWISRPLPIAATSNISAITVNPGNKNEVWVTISGYNATEKVYRSIDAGVTWTNLSRALPNTPVYSIVCANTPNGGVYIGTEIGVFYTNSFLADWVPFSNGLPHVPVTDLQLNYANGTLKAATYGRGIWQSDLFQSCSPEITIDYVINQGQYNFEASGTIVANKLIEGGMGTRVTLKAASKITFLPDFKATYGSYIRATIGTCGSGVLSRPADSLGTKKAVNKILPAKRKKSVPIEEED